MSNQTKSDLARIAKCFAPTGKILMWRNKSGLRYIIPERGNTYEVLIGTEGQPAVTEFIAVVPFEGSVVLYGSLINEKLQGEKWVKMESSYNG